MASLPPFGPRHRSGPATAGIGIWIALALMLVVTASFPVGASWLPDSLEARPLNPFQEAAPRQSVTLLVEIENKTTERREFFPHVRVPEGWRVLLPPSHGVLEPGEVEIQTVVVLVPPDAPAGDHIITVSYDGDDWFPAAKASFTVYVAATEGVEVEFLEAPSYVVDEPYTVAVHVRNTGNVAGDFEFEIVENLGVGVAVHPPFATLEPGEALIVEGRIGKPPPLTEGRMHRLRFIARDASNPRVQAEASVMVELIPTALPPESAYHIFPMRARLGVTARHDRRARVVWSLHGSGRLRDDATTTLTVALRDDRQTLTARGLHYRATLGDQSFFLSRLTDGGTFGIGMDLWAEVGDWIGQVLTYRPAGGGRGPWRFGSRVTYQRSPRWDLSIHHFNRPDVGGSLWSIRPRALLGTGWDVEAEFGQHTGLGEKPKHAGRFQVTHSNGGTASILHWEDRAAGYRGRSHRIQNWRFFHAMPITSATRGNVSIQRREGAGESAASTFRQTAVGLSGRWGRGSWSARFTASVEDDPGRSAFHRNTVRLFVYRPLDAGRSLRHLISWNRRVHSDRREDERSGEYAVHYRLPLSNGSLTPFLRLRLSEESGQTERIATGFGARWDQRFQRLHLTLTAEVRDVGKSRYRSYVSGRYTLERGRVLEARAWHEFEPGRKPRYEATLGLNFPFNVPVSRRSDVGEVQGRIVDAEGRPIEGLVVRLNGLSVASGADGRYHFPAVPAGSGHLIISSEELGIDEVSEPATPLTVDIAPGDTVVRDFRIVKTGTLTGQVQVVMPQPNSLNSREALGMNSLDGPPTLHGVVVELRKESAVLRQMLRGEDNTFSFIGLEPGEWHLHVHRNGLSQLYEIRLGQTRFNVEPGQRYETIIEVTPVPRTVEFLEDSEIEWVEP